MPISMCSLNLITTLAVGLVRSGNRWDGGVSERDGISAAELGELFLGAVEADLESFDLAEPPFALGFGDTGFQVVAVLD